MAPRNRDALTFDDGQAEFDNVISRDEGGRLSIGGSDGDYTVAVESSNGGFNVQVITRSEQ